MDFVKRDESLTEVLQLCEIEGKSIEAPSRGRAAPPRTPSGPPGIAPTTMRATAAMVDKDKGRLWAS